MIVMKKYRSIVAYLTCNIPVHLINLLTSLLPNHSLSNRIRGFLIRLIIGRKIGKRFQVAPGVILNKPRNMVCGKNVYISYNCYINALGGLTIGDNAIVGPMCVLATASHAIVDGSVTHNAISAPIRIGAGTWLGSHVVVTGGVTIGAGAVVGANAVVTHNVPPHSFVGGVPAKVLG